MNAVACEIAWRTAAFSWDFVVGHLAAEANGLADALSRLDAPHDPAELPSEIAEASCLSARARVSSVWSFDRAGV